MHVTFDRRLKFYEDQIERNGYWLYDECYFYPRKKVVFRGRDFDVGTAFRSACSRSYSACRSCSGLSPVRLDAVGMCRKLLQAVAWITAGRSAASMMAMSASQSRRLSSQCGDIGMSVAPGSAQPFRASCTASGRRAATFSRVRAAPEGSRRPCSQS